MKVEFLELFPLVPAMSDQAKSAYNDPYCKYIFMD